ncbi:tetratricopeptide repeat protein [Campylobacter sp. CCS1377]|uniref:beta-lactamase n=1 Tax=Campylobacter sp. CCS1377 TaxID=3158229 RepID=A0AAU7E985_9BACT|nr:sel1 repeat family protein [Campylobacter jejuni]
MIKKILLFCCVGVFGLANDFSTAFKKYEEKNYQEAFEIFSALCEKNNAKACFSLALMYENAYGVKQDMQKAKAHYNFACNKGISSACFNLALLQDGKREIKLFHKKACDLAHTQACNALASLYEEEKDGEMALYFYEKSCKLKDSFACYKLANLNEQGLIVRQNLKLALSYYKKSCQFDFLESCYILGRYYQIKEKDDKLAKRYLGKACDGSHTQACAAYRLLN